MAGPSAAQVRALLAAATGVALTNQAAYGELDALAGDGDFGSVLARAAARVRAGLARGGDDPQQVLLGAAHAVSAVGGTTGPIWGIGLLRAAQAIGQGSAVAVRAAADAIADLGGARAGDRTLLDALLPIAAALEEGADPVTAARAGADATSRMPARRGRASYVPGHGLGHVDAGAQAVADMAAAIVAGAALDPSLPELAVTGAGDPQATASPGHVVADPDLLVDDAIEGLIGASNGRLRAERDPRFVARADLPQPGLVALISGGGSGHEPMHAGLIGPGLLAAACPGEVFASPSAAQVAAAIGAVDSGEGVLLIVKNYTGDVLNFRLGADLARADGHRVETVLVADDIALDGDLDGNLDGNLDEDLDEDSPVGRRGVAGTIVVEKICGAAAEAGADLPTLAELGRRVAAATRSLGVAVSGVTLPASGVAAITLAAGEQEFGVGIHGEAGRERGPQQRADELVARMCHALLPVESSRSHVDAQAPVLLYTNGLGGLAGLELSAVHAYALRHLRAAGYAIARSMSGSLVTSLGMVGFSLTVTRLDEELLALWDAPCAAAAWTVS
jgi:dihydroxyacetone kinase